MKKFVLFALAALIAGSAVAETDYSLFPSVRQLLTRVGRAERDIDSLEAGTNVTLAVGKIFIGDNAGLAAAQTMNGDATIGPNGTVAISAGVIVNADVATNAAIVGSKLDLANDIVSADIVDGTIVNADIATNAAIAGSKLDLSSPGAIGATTPAAGAFTTLDVSGVVTANGGAVISGGSGLLTMADEEIVGYEIPASALSLYSLVELAITNDAAGSWTNVTFAAPGAANVGKRVSLYTAATNPITFIDDAVLESAGGDVTLDAAYESVTIMGNTAASWIVVDQHQP